MSEQIPDWARDLTPSGKPESCEPAKPYRDPGSYSIAEIAGMPTDDRASLQARQAIQRFYRWLDVFETAWGFPWGGPDFGMAQVLPWQEVTLPQFESLARGSGRSVAELKEIAARAKEARKAK